MTENKMTLGKWLAQQGVASRRKSVELITSGKVAVNGAVITKPFFRIDETKDVISYAGKTVRAKEGFEYYALYKPRGYVASTTTDETGRPPATQLVKTKSRLYPVGRLDIDSEGLLILTNDGELTYKLTHPKFGVKKTYKVLVGGQVTEDKLRRFKNGVLLSEGRTKSAQAIIIGRQQGKTWMEITISEGKYHQIRRMCARLSLHVDRLIRTKEGGIELGDLEEGQWRKCEAVEIEILRNETA